MRVWENLNLFRARRNDHEGSDLVPTREPHHLLFPKHKPRQPRGKKRRTPHDLSSRTTEKPINTKLKTSVLPLAAGVLCFQHAPRSTSTQEGESAGASPKQHREKEYPHGGNSCEAAAAAATTNTTAKICAPDVIGAFATRRAPAPPATPPRRHCEAQTNPAMIPQSPNSPTQRP